jgi:serine palmitoyltransferase
MQDCWNRPIDSAPGSRIRLVVRDSDDGNKTLSITENRQELLNLGSYNYLGFADDWQVSFKLICC